MTAYESSDAAWNVLEDLHFLLAKDETLHEELTNVCDILEEQNTAEESDDSTATTTFSTRSGSSPPAPTSSATTASRRASPPSIVGGGALKPPAARGKGKQNARPHFEVRQKQEMLLLRQQVDELKRHLNESQAKAKRVVDMSLWEKAAKLECMEKQKALMENEQLKEAVNQQATFIEHMEKLCRKKPRLTMSDPHSEAWQCYRLAAHESLRMAAIHAIADRQLRRMQNAFIQAGIYGRKEDIYRANVVPQAGNSYMFEMVNHMTLPAPYRLVSEAAWKVFEGENAPTYPDGTVETVERIDNNTVYSQLSHQFHDGTTCHANIIRKRYVEVDREVVVSRTVLEDALVPHMTKGAVEDKWSWLEVVPAPNQEATHCCLSFVIQIVIDPTAATAVATTEEMVLLEAMMGRVSLLYDVDSAREEGALCLAQAVVESNDIPYPNMRGFVERGKLFIRALERSVNDAIRDHRQTLGSRVL
ncbi:Aste57867_23734 [Aphanomyces stellatus]|uniref:Aste57867_23734 protein n=1 Tax=Aphanomyces stellatus TaxID=120398 RepID=A0A485LNF9_9STRA|nr:hypothetical protein As57867_023662 [Aphanomyces stellatus]VFU00379.1 Aste57867_23734 [Aphanomyces stellatus]